VIPPLSFQDAEKAVAHARAKRDAEHAPLAGFIALALAALLSFAAPALATWRWSLAIAMILILVPAPLGRVMPRRGLRSYRFSLLSYPLNGLLLAVVAYREIGRIAPLLPEEWGLLQAVIPWTAPLFAALYYLLQYHGWRDRLFRLTDMKRCLQDVPSDAARSEIEHAFSKPMAAAPEGTLPPWAEFRTVPATLKNWRLFLKLDPEVHGPWYALFESEYAIVVTRDGRRAEAVKRGGLRIVAEDPSPGARTIQCLLRWNQHLYEGRIAPEHFYRIQAWNKGTMPETASGS